MERFTSTTLMTTTLGGVVQRGLIVKLFGVMVMSMAGLTRLSLIAPEVGLAEDGGSGFCCAHAACAEDRLDRFVPPERYQAAWLKPLVLDDVRRCVRSEHRL